MSSNRRGESGQIPFRRGRLYSVDHHWFAATREGAKLGPYPSKMEAKMAIASYLADRLFREEAKALAMSSTYAPVDLTVSEIRRFKQKLEDAGVTAALAWARQRKERLMGEDVPARQLQGRVSALDLMLGKF